MVFRLLAGLGATGVEKVWVMVAGEGLAGSLARRLAQPHRTAWRRRRDHAGARADRHHGGTRHAGAGDLGSAGPDHPSRPCRGPPAGVEVHVLDGQGHSPHMEAAGEVNRLIGRFVDAVG